MKTYHAVLLAAVLLLQPIAEARRGGGSFSRGNSAASRGNSGGFNSGGMSHSNQGNFHPNQGGFHPNQGGFQPNQGGFHPNQGGFHPNQGGFHPNAGGFHSGPAHFNPGNQIGSASRTSTFKHALAGAAVGTIGGLLVFEAGKAIINSATQPFHHDNRDYYFNRENYRGPQGRPVCSMPYQQLLDTNAAPATPATPAADSNATTAAPGAATTPNPNQMLAQATFRDGSRPKEIVWSCNTNEVCCGSECCPAPLGGSSASGHSSKTGIVLGIILLILVLSCCCCLLAYNFCRSSIEGFLPGRNQRYMDDSAKYDDGQTYPMGPYPPTQQQPYAQPYPPGQNLYPQYPPQQPAYPPQPAGYPPPPRY